MTETIQKGGSEGSAARNQSLFREVNERIARTGGTLQVPAEGFICECAHEDCFQPIHLTVDEYEAVRAHPTHFFVAPGDDHFVPEAETVIHKEDSHWIVEKVGRAGAVADKLDPRSRPTTTRRIEFPPGRRAARD